MTIQSVSSAATNAADPQSIAQQRRADFQALASALQSGDVNSAQQAFAQLQKDNPRLAQALNSAPSSSDSPRLADLKSLASALQSGDVTTAQQAFAKLQADMQSAQKSGRHHRHHGAAEAPPVAATTGGDTDGDNDGSTSVGSRINATA
jgi:ribosomal protein S20